MDIRNENGSLRITAPRWALSASGEGISVCLDGEEIAFLDPLCGADILNGGNEPVADEGAVLSGFTADASSGAAVWTFAGGNWDSRTLTLHCTPEHFTLTPAFTGHGRVDRVLYFAGDPAKPIHGSRYEFAEGYTPLIPLQGGDGVRFAPFHNQDMFSYLTVPPMYCYVFRTEGISPLLCAGLVAAPGEHNFTQFNYAAVSTDWQSRFLFTTDQSGHTPVDGTWAAPSVVFYAAQSEHEALREYASLYPRPAARPLPPRFWHGPIVCGWQEQLARVYRGYPIRDIQHACRQDVYKDLLELAEKRKLHPQILIIDDKWQKNYGFCDVDTEKWPDMRGFIDGAHEKGICTMLWFRMWDSEGIPEEYTIPDERSGVRRADPSHPGYRALLKERLHFLLSGEPGCLDADGLKLDYAFWQPLGRSACSYSGRYGAELFHTMLELIYTAVKEIKPYAVVNCSPCHPYFASFCDHARLHDYDYRARRAFEEFSRRAELYRIAMPGALIDTDGAGNSSYRDTLRYLLLAPQLGIPDAYCLTPTPGAPISEPDWADVAAAWDSYSRRVDALYRK